MNLFKILKARQKTDVVVLDFSKVFDVVPHERLLTLTTTVFGKLLI